MTDPRRASPELVFGVLGFISGGVFGFLLRPSAMLVGQLPFETVIARGANLRGLDTILAPVAQISFYIMLAGAIGGAILGFMSGRAASSMKSSA